MIPFLLPFKSLMKDNKRDSNINKPPAIVVKMLRFKDKTKVFQNPNKLTGQNVFINNDFGKKKLGLRKDLMIEVKGLMKLSKVAYSNYITKVFRENIEEEM